MEALAVFRRHQRQLSEVRRHEFLDFEADLIAEIHQRESAFNQETTLLVEEIGQLRRDNARLLIAQAENECLNQQLNDPKLKFVLPNSESTNRDALTEVNMLTEKPKEDLLQERYERLQAEYRKLSKAHVKLIEKSRKERKTVKAWKIYADQQKLHRKKKGGSASSPEIQDDVKAVKDLGQELLGRNDQSNSNATRSSTSRQSSPSASCARPLPPNGLLQPLPRPTSDRLTVPAPSSIPPVYNFVYNRAENSTGSSQITVDESINPVEDTTAQATGHRTQSESGEEALVFVSMRTLKRKRSSVINNQPSMPKVHIKEEGEEGEEDEGVDLGDIDTTIMNNKESGGFDLDEDEPIIGTPRKRSTSEDQLPTADSAKHGQAIAGAPKLQNQNTDLSQSFHVYALEGLLENPQPSKAYLVPSKRRMPQHHGALGINGAELYSVGRSMPFDITNISEKYLAASNDKIMDDEVVNVQRQSLLSILRSISTGCSDPQKPSTDASTTQSSLFRTSIGRKSADKTSDSFAISDFTVNPNHNHGMNYAYGETVRVRKERQCLPGCTRPDCCGNRFRRLIEIGGLPQTKHILQWNSQSEDDEQQIMETLSCNPGQMQPQPRCVSRADLLSSAQIKRFADQYGRHRNAFERAPTPPGFWRTDMPTSQEVEEDRLKAATEEQRKIKDRYQEALKEDGRWIMKNK